MRVRRDGSGPGVAARLASGALTAVVVAAFVLGGGLAALADTVPEEDAAGPAEQVAADPVDAEEPAVPEAPFNPKVFGQQRSATITAPSWQMAEQQVETWTLYRTDLGGGWVSLGTYPITQTSIVDGPLVRGQTYWYRVAVSNAAGTSPLSGQTYLQVSWHLGPENTVLRTGDGRVELEWDVPCCEPPETLDVERASSVDGPWEVLATVETAAAAYTDRVANNEVHYYRLASTDEVGTVTTDPMLGVAGVVPGAPSVTATRADAAVALGWVTTTPGTSAVTGYQVEVLWGDWRPVATVAGTASGHVVTGLYNGETYGFRVRAVNASGAGPWTTVSQTPWGLPDAPLLRVTPYPTMIDVYWDPTLGPGGPATHWTVQRSADGGKTWKTIASRTVHSFVDQPLAAGTRFTYRVASVNAAGQGPWSPPLTATVGPVPAKVSLTAEARSTSVRLTWPAASSPHNPVQSYVVQYAAQGGAWVTAATLAASARTHTVTGLQNGTSHTFRVRAVNAVGNAAWATVSAVPRTTASAPRSVTATPDRASVVVRWTAPSSSGGASRTSYLVQVSTDGRTWRTVSSTVAASATSYRVTGLSNGVTYRVRVLARNAAGNGAWSEIVTVRPRTVPSAPRSTTVAAGNGTLTVRWTAPSSSGGASRTSYLVQVSSDGRTWRTVSSTVAASATSYRVTGLSNGVTYRVRVLARNAAGNGAWSSVVAAMPRTTPSAPRSVTAAATAGAITVRWTAPASSGGLTRSAYVVQYSTNGTTWRTASSTVKPSATSYRITGLSNGTTYRVRVIAVNAAGRSPASTLTSARPRTTPAVPRPVVSYPGSGEARIRWDAPSNGGSAITRYVVQRYSGGTWRTIRTLPATTMTVTVERLVNGVSQQFRVVASNAVGNTASASVTAVPRAPAGCHPSYGGVCVPIARDVDCAGGSGDGPKYVRGPVYVLRDDPYGLDRDGDRIACEL